MVELWVHCLLCITGTKISTRKAPWILAAIKCWMQDSQEERCAWLDEQLPCTSKGLTPRWYQSAGHASETQRHSEYLHRYVHAYS